MLTMTRSFALVRTSVLCVGIILLSTPLVWGQQGKVADEGSDPRIVQMSKKIEELEKALSEFRFQAFTIVTGVLGLGGIAGLLQLVSWSRGSRREKIVTDLLELIKVGEAASQTRASAFHDAMLDKGQKTIVLVNETLALAKEATESAINSAKKRVTTHLKELDDEISEFLFPYANRDNREVVNKSAQKDKLKSLVDKLISLEYANGSLEERQALTPNCLFLKALKYYTEHQFDLSIKALQDIVEHSEASDDLRVRSWYWIGYQQNIVGAFGDAENSFTNAIEDAGGERRLELERLRIETMLFDKNNQAEKLIDDIDGIIRTCGNLDHLEDMRNRAIQTKGNILYAASMDAYTSGDRNRAITYMQQAKGLWEPLFRAGNNRLAEREFAFACLALNENTDAARELLERKVRRESRLQYTSRTEPRDKVNYSVIQLMIAKAADADERVESLDTRINLHIADIHEREWIYSYVRRRLVNRQEFLDDVRSIIDNGVPYLN